MKQITRTKSAQTKKKASKKVSKNETIFVQFVYPWHSHCEGWFLSFCYRHWTAPNQKELAKTIGGPFKTRNEFIEALAKELKEEHLLIRL